MRKGILEYCLLACLEDGPSYGLELAGSLGGDQALFSSSGTLYPLLARVRRQGWVETSWRESTNGPPRRYYSLTPSGRAALTVFKATWTDFRRAVDALVEARQ